MEALRGGVPVVGVGCPLLGEVLEGTPARVCEADATSIETALRQELSEPRTARAGGYAAEARERFDARHGARRLVELYDRLTSGAEGRRAA
jgi:glycosyltransferase involved in cell wall biosynthesis